MSNLNVVLSPKNEFLITSSTIADFRDIRYWIHSDRDAREGASPQINQACVYTVGHSCGGASTVTLGKAIVSFPGGKLALFVEIGRLFFNCCIKLAISRALKA